MPFWSVARTMPQREAFAAERLMAAGFETFAPRTKANGRAEPLFRGYIFVRIEGRWRAIDYTHGVLKLVRFGEQPARCPDLEVARLQPQTDQNGFVHLPDRPPMAPRRKIPAGVRVKITAGPFAGMGALCAGMTAGERVLVLLSVLGGPRPVAIPAHQVVQQ
jgi:transcriptional antiterminator RfaH